MGDLSRSKNRLKVLLKFQGIEIPAKHGLSNWSRNVINSMDEQAAKDTLLQDAVELMWKK